jgi:hypothetical protein
MAITETMKLLIAVAIGGIVLWGGQKIISWRTAALQNETRGNVIADTSGNIADGIAAEQKSFKISEGLDLGRIKFQLELLEAKQNEPEVADRADRPVPRSVRNAYRARRLARERLGCAPSECPQGDAADVAPKR